MRRYFYVGLLSAFAIGFTAPMFLVGRGSWFTVLTIAVDALILITNVVAFEDGDTV